MLLKNNSSIAFNISVKSVYYNIPLNLNIAKPFVKWAGGKRSIIDALLKRIPSKINNYYEPFIGGGALFFELNKRVNHAYISDLNYELINAYDAIRNAPYDLIKILQIHQTNHSEDYFYQIRALYDLDDSSVESAARFIYLMKTCYNGLYRANKKNQFNTPIGSYKKPTICDEKNIIAVHNALQNASIAYQDFGEITPNMGDFVYFDPPYHPVKKDSFTKYLQNGFDEKEQIRLRDFVRYLSKFGVNVMISNSDTKLINEIYSDFKIEKIPVSRMIGGKYGRETVFELVITNY